MKFDHVGLSVADIDAMSGWYADALDLTPVTPFELAGLGLRGVFLVHETGWAIELLHREGNHAGLSAPDAPTAALTRGFGHLCVRVEDVDEVYARLVGAGAEDRMSPRAAPEPGVRMAFVADPEGNLIEVIDRQGPAGS